MIAAKEKPRAMRGFSDDASSGVLLQIRHQAFQCGLGRSSHRFGLGSERLIYYVEQIDEGWLLCVDVEHTSEDLSVLMPFHQRANGIRLVGRVVILKQLAQAQA